MEPHWVEECKLDEKVQVAWKSTNWDVITRQQSHRQSESESFWQFRKGHAWCLALYSTTAAVLCIEMRLGTTPFFQFHWQQKRTSLVFSFAL